MAKLRDFIASHRRWMIVVLLAGFSLVNYIDRQALPVLATELRSEFGMTTEQYSYIVSTFLAAYAIGYGIAGTTLDRVGVKVGLAVALAFWSVVAMGHAAVTGWLSLAAARFLLGTGQSFNAPGGMKGIAEWIPRRERGLCSAIFSNANSLGAVLAPPLVGTLALWLGWRWAFLITGTLGFGLLAVWWRVYRSPEEDTALSEGERTYIMGDRADAEAGRPPEPASYGKILRDPLCLTLCCIRFLTDPFSYFISFWLIDYFRTVRGFSLETIVLLGWLPYLASPFFGGPIGGALSDWLVRRGVAVCTARMRLMLGAACVTPLALVAVRTEHAWLAVVISFFLVAANSCWNVNKLTLVSELVSRHQVASIVSLGGIAGSVGGVLSTLLAGKLIATIGYVPVFTGIGVLHLAAFSILALVQRRFDGKPAVA